MRKRKRSKKSKKNSFLHNGIYYSHKRYEIKSYNGNEFVSLKSKTQKYKERIYRNSKSTTNAEPKIYVILCWKGREKFLKVGMTTRSIENRFKEIPYKYKVIKFVEINQTELYEYEQAIHGLLRKHKYYPSIKFGGYTECYKMEAKNEILAYI